VKEGKLPIDQINQSKRVKMKGKEEERKQRPHTFNDAGDNR
jgi:hypothetical protein